MKNPHSTFKKKKEKEKTLLEFIIQVTILGFSVHANIQLTFIGVSFFLIESVLGHSDRAMNMS